MRILVTGANGRLGRALCRLAEPSGFSVIPFSRSNADLADADQLDTAVRSVKEFDALINPAAISGVDDCEKHPDSANKVNTKAPAILASVCRERGVPMIHISTDYVFAGDRPGHRRVEEPCCPVNHYGRSKRAGEIAVLSADPRFWVTRVSWLFGQDKPAFAENVLDRARKGVNAFDAVADKYSGPTWCDDIVPVLFNLLKPTHDAGGVVHVANRGLESWYSYAREVLDQAEGLGWDLPPTKLRPTALATMGDVFTATRPIHTALDVSRVENLIGHPMRPWQEALSEYLQTKRKPLFR